MLERRELSVGALEWGLSIESGAHAGRHPQALLIAIVFEWYTHPTEARQADALATFAFAAWSQSGHNGRGAR